MSNSEITKTPSELFGGCGVSMGGVALLWRLPKGDYHCFTQMSFWVS